ncbi:preprotein translocase subunit SecY [Candidatus Woesebacteria bacterium CG_4_10_14_0_2_um_filter_44_9]|uniref:Protein translocase subunit SecY n=2 Tax=Candidatus Woeseibacteriota TaxID=1752722 RepID=A0A2H0BHU5_9BACT|nr:MAG: preprotein translocase subunit SecY [Candidatus Woesebacteria bacterium CG22_combo_CG10-13_8_21_14_all_45_10]PIZ46352.1 MAG: preprotein translocase subunit SecY [Candidatus Woesebacteria bacterium CG_4_10_14_0_2_um_filter_44_9]
MLKTLVHFFVRVLKSSEIRKKVIITALILVVFRFTAHIPAAGMDRTSLKMLFYNSPFLSLLDVFSGGTLANFSILALGLNPYINASIIFQLLAYVVPSIEALQKEGEYGQEKLNQYTKLLTVPLAAIQGLAMYSLLKSQHVISSLSPLAVLSLVLTMTAGTVFAVWLGDLISEHGLKDGISFLIFVGIVSRLPISLGQSVITFQSQDLLKVGLFLGMALLVIAGIVFMNEAVRKIPIHYSRRSGNSSLSPVTSYLPLRLNQAGVIPIIFAVSLVLVPSLISQFLANSANPILAHLATGVGRVFSPQSLVYNLVYFLLIFGFTYFYTAVVFNPDKISENLQKGGGFIPGIRPGSSTAKYLSFVLGRITLIGGIFLGLVAILPSFFQKTIGVANLAIGGTGVLIVVSVVLEVIRQLEGELAMRKYETFIR